MKTKIILDTSTLMNLALVCDPKWRLSSQDIENYNFEFQAIETAIESLIVYDDILIDGASFKVNLRHDENISKIVKSFCNVVEHDEDKIYSEIERKYKMQLLSDISDITPLFRPFKKKKHHYIFQATSRSHISNPLLRLFVKKLELGNRYDKYDRRTLGNRYDIKTCRQIVRYLYYKELQEKEQSDLVLHPNKQFMFTPINFSKDQKSFGFKILRNFGESIANGLYIKENEWLGIVDSSIRLPLLFEYIIKKQCNTSNLLDVIQEVRVSKKARKYREGLSLFIDAYKSRDIKVIHETLTSLDNASKEWNKDLGYNPTRKYRKISISIPMVGGVSADFVIPFPNFRKETISDKLLMFTHELVKNI